MFRRVFFLNRYASTCRIASQTGRQSCECSPGRKSCGSTSPSCVVRRVRCAAPAEQSQSAKCTTSWLAVAGVLMSVPIFWGSVVLAIVKYSLG